MRGIVMPLCKHTGCKHSSPGECFSKTCSFFTLSSPDCYASHHYGIQAAHSAFGFAHAECTGRTWKGEEFSAKTDTCICICHKPEVVPKVSKQDINGPVCTCDVWISGCSCGRVEWERTNENNQ